jgi:hypothetical protein
VGDSQLVAGGAARAARAALLASWRSPLLYVAELAKGMHANHRTPISRRRDAAEMGRDPKDDLDTNAAQADDIDDQHLSNPLATTHRKEAMEAIQQLASQRASVGRPCHRRC